MSATELWPSALIRWRSGRDETYGTVVRTESNGRRVTVRLDGEGERVFAWPSDVLERVVLPVGEHVRVTATGVTGLVTAARERNGCWWYQVSAANGTHPTVMEDGLRPAPITHPAERLRAGELHSARSTNLRIAATRLLFAYQHDDLSALGNSRVELKPHQVGVTHRVVATYPHRFILADEVGLGKTIEAGLLIRELQARGVAKRVLVLAPSGLVAQWQQELKTKFNLTFSVYNRDTIRYLEAEKPGENAWTLKDTVISSTSFASWDDARRKEIADAGWDMVVIDEAHHARRTFQGRGKYTSTNLYRLAERLADPDLARAQAMLLLSATPMQLHRFELYSLIELLDPALFPTFEDFERHTSELRGLNEAVDRFKRWPSLAAGDRELALMAAEGWLGSTRAELEGRAASDPGGLVEELSAEHRLSRVMVRNRKRVVGGFMPRAAAIWEVELTPEEWQAHQAVNHYIRTGFARSKETKNNALGFLMVTFQKMHTSSSHALKCSLMRRVARLNGVASHDREAAILKEIDLDELPSRDELDALLAVHVENDAEEVRELEQLVERLSAIALDTKAKVLIANLATILERDPDAKVLLFTQFRDTQEYLLDHLPTNWDVHLFHGGLKVDEKDAAVARFRDGDGPQMLLSTEAGGEGRNFQYCHILINYDLPWNPMRVEQRIGRLDRIGQKHPVTVFNFSTTGTVEERVVEVLTNRIGVFRDTIGGLDPILGEVENDLRKIFLMGEERAKEEFAALEARLETQLAAARAAEEQMADLIMDTRSYRRDEVAALLERPSSVDPQHIKRFVLGALAELRVVIDKVPDDPGVYVLHLGSRDFESKFPEIVRDGAVRHVTFDLPVALEREEVEFLAFGHPVVEALVARARTVDYGGRTSVRRILTDEMPRSRGWLFIYELELGGLTARRELLAVFVHPDGRTDPELASWLLERSMSGRMESFREPLELPARDGAFEEALAAAEEETVTALLDQQAQLQAINLERLEEERRKRERFYDYRSIAAEDKRAANQRTYDRLLNSPEDDDRRILPIWDKHVRDAESMIEAIEIERVERLAQLDGKEQVTAQHQLFAASYVSIEPELEPLYAKLAESLTLSMFETFKRLCRPATAEQLSSLRPLLAKRRRELVALEGKVSSDIALASAIAEALDAALEDPEVYAPSERQLLVGAAKYFLLLEDEDHDLKSPDGFVDDALVAASVIRIVGRPELVVDLDRSGVPVIAGSA